MSGTQWNVIQQEERWNQESHGKMVQAESYYIKCSAQTQKHESIMPFSYLNPRLKLLSVCILCNLGNVCIYHEARMGTTSQGKQCINDGQRGTEGSGMHVRWKSKRMMRVGQWWWGQAGDIIEGTMLESRKASSKIMNVWECFIIVI